MRDDAVSAPTFRRLTPTLVILSQVRRKPNAIEGPRVSSDPHQASTTFPPRLNFKQAECKTPRAQLRYSSPVTSPIRILALGGSLLAACVHAQVAGGPKAENRRMRLDQEGTGVWTQSGHPGARITHVTLGGNPTQPMGIEFTLADGTRRALSATLERKDSELLVLKIVGLDNAKAKGELTIHYGPKNSIRTLSGRGSLHGKHFRMRFEGSDIPAVIPSE